MKICLGMINKNDRASLERHLPIIRPCFDGAVVVDAESFDGSQEVFKKNNFEIIEEPWDNDFSEARNLVIRVAEALEYTHLFMLDSDECMFPESIEIVKKHLEHRELIYLPRIEFVKDRNHFNPKFYPDFQGRVFRLGIFYHYQNRVHEMLYKGEDKVKARKTKINPLMLPQSHIFHYGKCRSKEYLWLKYQNYIRTTIGLPLLAEVPENEKINEKKSWGGEPVRFYGRQPC